MSEGAQEFGISNVEYDLVTTLSNLLEGMEVLGTYAEDAEEEHNMEVAEIFRTIQANNLDAAMRIRATLGRMITRRSD